MDRVRAAADSGQTGLVWSANYSIGVNAFLQIVAEAARQLAHDAEFGAWAWEIHHAAKKDAPSGTLLKLVNEMKRSGYAPRFDQLESRRRDPRHKRNRFRFTRRHDNDAVAGKKGFFEFREIIHDLP